MNALFAEHALLPDGWARNVRLAWNSSGTLTEVSKEVEPEAQLMRASGPVLPGMPNLHSHAFQRAMTGLTNRKSVV